MRPLVLSLLFALGASPALAQRLPQGPTDQLPPYVFDVRGLFAFLKADETTAHSLGILPANLPGHGLGLVAGAHIYPLRHGGFALGLGGELAIANGSAQERDE